MPNVRIHLIYLAVLIGGMLFSGCLPGNCLNRLPELKKANAEVKQITVTDTYNIDPVTGRPLGTGPQRNTQQPLGQTRSTFCTKDFASIRINNQEIVLFVDAKLANHGKGDSWANASKSLMAAVKSAIDIRSQELRLATVQKKITIVVAGGEYSLLNEAKIMAEHGGVLLGNASIINLEGYDPRYVQKIDILGGYRADDECLDRMENVRNDPRGEADRTTIIDGTGDAGAFSNHLFNIADNAEDIIIKKFTLKNGKALNNEPLEPLKRFGGAILVQTNAKNILLEDLTIESAEAADKGGCVAIVGNGAGSPENVTLKNSTLNGCTAVNGGSGLFVGGDAHTITVEDVSVNDCHSSHVNSTGGGVMISDNAGAGGAAENIKFIRGKITENSAHAVGGGVSINTNAEKIKFEDVVIEHNHVTAVGSKGGGFAIDGPGVGVVSVTGGSIASNDAVLLGGGVSISNTGAGVMVAAPNALPAPKFTFNNVTIKENSLNGATGNEKGAGVMIVGPASDIKITGDAISRGAISRNKGNAQGIGLAIFGQVYHVEIDGVQIEGNHVLMGGAAQNGNGIFVSDNGVNPVPGRILVKNGHINNHQHGINGAGFFANQTIGLEIIGVSFANNHSTTDGGSLYVTNSNIVAHSGNTYANNTAGQHGGGFYVDASMNANLTNANRALEMVNITCTSNSAVNNGGCAFIDHAPATVITGGTFTNNGLPVVAHAIINPTERGGAVYYVSNSLVGGTDNNAKLLVQNTSFSGNRAFIAGGALYTANVFDLEFSNNVSFSLNWATRTVGGPLGVGGAVFADFTNYLGAASVNHQHGAKILMTNGVSFLTNTAVGDGGAVHFGQEVRLFEAAAGVVTFSNNSSTQGQGGAVFAGFIQPGAGNSRLWLSNSSSFDSNHADHGGSRGGAVYVDPAPRRVELAAKFNANTANAGGAGVIFTGADPIRNLVTYQQTEFTNNVSATGNGGGLLLETNITNQDDFMGKYRVNWATTGLGGAVAFMGNLPAARFKTDRAEFDGNIAGDHDPALHLANIPAAGLEFANTKFLHHTRASVGCGGLMEITTAIDRLLFNRVEITDNKTTNGNGGAFCVSTVAPNQLVNNLTITDSIITLNKAFNGAGGFLWVAGNNPNLVVDMRRAAIAEHPKIENNQALAGNGGVLSIPRIRSFKLIDAKLAHNTATGDGGAIDIGIVDESVEITSANGTLKNFYLSLLQRVTGFPNLPVETIIGRATHNSALGNGGAFHFGSVGQDVIVSNQIWAGNSANNGGALHVGQLVLWVRPLPHPGLPNNNLTTFQSTILSANTAVNNGGAVNLPNLANTVLEMKLADGGVAGAEYVANRTLRKVFANFYSALNQLSTHSFDALNNTDPGGAKEGMFLIEENEATNGNGGALYANNVNEVTAQDMSFANNEATVGTGGTLFVDNLRNTMIMRRSIIFGGKAGENAGGIYVMGSNVPNDPRALEMNGSSIQDCEVAGGVGINGSAGVFMTRMNVLEMRPSNFFGNRVLNVQGGTSWAAALKFLDRADGLPLANGAFNAANPVAMGNQPLLAGRVPVEITGPVRLEDNTVPGPPFGPFTIGTISIPAAIHGPAPNYFIFDDGAGAFVQLNNAPPPANNLARSVVIAH